jgi:hypothetical protein
MAGAGAAAAGTNTGTGHVEDKAESPTGEKRKHVSQPFVISSLTNLIVLFENPVIFQLGKKVHAFMEHLPHLSLL